MSRYRPAFALFVVGGLAAFIAVQGLLTTPLMLLAGFLCLGGVGVLVYQTVTRDKYDLNELRRLQDEEEFDAVEEPQDYDGLLCPHCHFNYNPGLPACPRCGRSPFN